MHATQHEVRMNWRMLFLVLTAVSIATWCTASQAQAIIGSTGNGWQSWNLAQDANNEFIDLNSNGAPYWDVPLLTFGNYNVVRSLSNKSVGWCLTSTGDCQGLGSALNAPGPLPFWGGPYNTATDSGGAMDPTVYFRTTSSGQTFQATLYLNTATNNYEINEFGWFETNATGTVIGTRHVLFQGSGYPAGSANPDPVGKVVTFTPTQYFGYYYADESDPEQIQNPPAHGCLAYTIFKLNEEDCTAQGTAPVGSAGNGQGDHVFAIFLQQVPNRAPVYWVAGQDPSKCSDDGDCNLTIVKVRRMPLSD